MLGPKRRINHQRLPQYRTRPVIAPKFAASLILVSLMAMNRGTKAIQIRIEISKGGKDNIKSNPDNTDSEILFKVTRYASLRSARS